MTADTCSEGESPSLDALALVDEICHRFEAECQAGRQPRLEDFLAEVQDPVRQQLLPALLAVELGQRCREYRRRFPEAVRVFPRLLAEAVDNEIRDGQTPPHISATGIGPSVTGLANATGPVVLGDYEILEELGRGGMGVVYKARQRSANRVVALKVIRADRLEERSEEERQGWLDRFQREAHAAARLVHDYILPVYEVGEVDGRHFYSMRYVEGHSLADALRERPLPDRAAAECLERVARAVHQAHLQGVLHRDLKPANILLDAEQRPYVTDFGLAKWAEGPQDMTHTGQWLGSPPYLSPEQSRDAAGVTTASDVYSLGATLYHALTGRPPFQAANVLETLRQVREAEPVPPRRLNPAVPRDLETICLKCLHKEPQQRYASAAELADDLRRFLDGKPIRARPTSVWQRVGKWARRNPVVSSLVVLVFLALTTAVAGLGLWARSEQRANDFAQEALRREREITDYLDHSADLTFALVDEQFGQFSLQPAKSAVGAEGDRVRMTDQGVEDFEKAIRDLDPLYDPLERLDPENAQRAFRFGRIRTAMGDHLNLNRNKPNDSLVWFERAVPLLEAAVQAEPANQLYRRYGARAHTGWGHALSRLGRHEECLVHRERAVELAEGDARMWKRNRLFLAQTLARVGQHARAVREARELAALGPIFPQGTACDLAAIWAVAAAKVDAAEDVASAERAERKEQYARRAVELLRRVEIDYFRDPQNWDFVRKDADFAALRGRPDFEAFCRDIEAKRKR